MFHKKSLDTKQRLNERKRQVGRTDDWLYSTNETDTTIINHICGKYPLKFGRPLGVGTGPGRELITFLRKDLELLDETINRFINKANFGNDKLHAYSMREEQKACLAKTFSFFQNKENSGKEFLWNAKMRFGKSFTAYKLIMQSDARLVLILTNRPTDTIKAWIDEKDHVDFDFDYFIDASKQGSIPIVVDPNKRTIIFSSLQDFICMIEGGGFKEKFANFPKLNFDLIIADEYHLGDTEKKKKAIAKLQYKNILNLSGTPFQALSEERFSDDAMFTWSYIDEQKARKQEIARLGIKKAKTIGQYYWLSPMKLFTIALSENLLSSDPYKEADLFTEEEGFSLYKLFAAEKINDEYVFKNDIAVNLFLNSLCHGFVMPYSRQAHNARQYSAINLKHTLWYVPGVAAAYALAAVLEKHEIFKKYAITIAAGDNGDQGNDTTKLVSDSISHVESGRDKLHIGTIVISCGKLSHGVSIPEWGSVLLLNDTTSDQLYFQLIFRGQTPWKGRKNECYVFDFNPNRTLKHIHSLAKASAGTGDIMPVAKEILNMFNVLSYEDNGWNQVNVDDLMTKVYDSFGRATSLKELQDLFGNLSVDIDKSLKNELKLIDVNVVKTTTKVSGNDIKNGKNSKSNDRSDNHNDDDFDNDNEKKKPSNEDTRARDKAKIVLESIPLYLITTRDLSYEDMIYGMNSESGDIACKSITGVSGREIRKILNNQPDGVKRSINEGIMRLRRAEKEIVSAINSTKPVVEHDIKLYEQRATNVKAIDNEEYDLVGALCNSDKSSIITKVA
jgi:hypothetical protein